MSAATVRRRPSGWYAALYRRTYGETAVVRRVVVVPAGAWVGLLLVVGGVFTPWVRESGDWISAKTSLDVPLRAMWAADAAVGTENGGGVAGVAVGFLGIVLAVVAVVALAGRLPGWVKTVAALGIVLIPSAVAAQLNQQLSGTGTAFLEVVGPGMLLMLAGGVVLAFTKPRRGNG